MLIGLQHSLRRIRLASGSALTLLLVSCAVDDAATAPTLGPAEIGEVRVLPESTSVFVGQPVRLQADVRDPKGKSLQGDGISWTSTNTSIATVDSTGTVQLLSSGQVEIRASVRGKSGRSKLTASPIPVAVVTVSPTSASVTAGQSVRLTATTRSATDSVLTGRAISWSSSNQAVATVDSTGLVRATASGTVQISATSEGISANAMVTVTANAPGTVTDLRVPAVSDSSVTLAFTEVSNGVGGATKYIIRYAASPMSWGTATGVTRGTCTSPLTGSLLAGTITCTALGLQPSTAYGFQLVAFRGTSGVDAIYGELSNAVIATTSASAVTSVSVAPGTSTVLVGATVAFAAAVRDRTGTMLTGRAVAWTSTNPSVATVSATGVATGVSAGSATIRATSEGVTGTASLVVNVAATTLTSLTLSPSSVSLTSGAVQQFSVTGRMSDGSVVAPAVTYSATGGSITTGGLFIAGSAAGDFRVVATAAGSQLADTVGITVSLANVFSYPNQPAGLTGFAETDYSAPPGLAGFPGVIDGNFQTLRNPSTRIVSIADAGSPRSPGSVLQIDFASGTQPGYSAPSGYRLFTGWDGPENLSNTEYSEFYESTFFKVAGTEFETQQVGVKMLGYWGVADNNGDPATSPGPVQLYAFFRNRHEGGSGTSFETSWNVDAYSQGVNSLYYPQNRNLAKRAEVGRWHRYETYMKLNTVGQANGIWRWWLDGVLVGEYTDMVFITAARSSGFFGRTYDAVWGGQGGTAKTRTDYLLIDHTYMSGVFLRNKAP